MPPTIRWSGTRISTRPSACTRRSVISRSALLGVTSPDHPDKRSAHAQRDDWLKREIQRVYDENHQVYGVRKVWCQLLREGIRVARCTVARLMAVMGLAGVLRGKKVRTTVWCLNHAFRDMLHQRRLSSSVSAITHNARLSLISVSML